MAVSPSGVRLTKLATLLLALIRETVEEVIPFDAVVLEVERPGGAAENHFGSDGCFITLRSAVPSEGTAELEIMLGAGEKWEEGSWIDVALNDGGRNWEICNNGKVSASGEALVFDELRQLVRHVLSGRTEDDSELGAVFSPYPTTTA